MSFVIVAEAQRIVRTESASNNPGMYMQGS